MTQTRQQLLILNLASPDLESRAIAWALYDGTLKEGEIPMQSGDAGAEGKPPYHSVLDAMRDGWRVIKLPTLPYFVEGREHETGHLPYEYVLEKLVELS
jgi:hypothetical protein